MSGDVMEGVDVDGMEEAARKCLEAADVAREVIQVMEGIVAALSALSFFAGPWVAPLIAFIQGTVIPWLRNVEQALRGFGQVLAERAAAQRRVSAGEPVDIAALPSYSPFGGAPAPVTPVTPTTTPVGPVTPIATTPTTPTMTTGSAGPGPSVAPIPPSSGSSATEPISLVRATSGGASGTALGGPALGGMTGRSTIEAGQPATPTLAPGAPPVTGQPVNPVMPVRETKSDAVTIGAASAAGGVVVGGVATYAVTRRRRDDTDGSELLGQSTVDRPVEGGARPDTLTAADLRGANDEVSRAGAPAAERPGRQRGASTQEGAPP